jgi:hypothetical protein
MKGSSLSARWANLTVALVTAIMIVAAPGIARAADQSPMNSLFVIAPYKHQGTWVFDDPKVGLHQEPFVLGIDKMIDHMVADVPHADRGFRAIFSAQKFPGAETKLEWRRSDSGGNWYYSDKFKMEGWLCPALFKYFPKAPREIWVKVEALSR